MKFNSKIALYLLQAFYGVLALILLCCLMALVRLVL